MTQPNNSESWDAVWANTSAFKTIIDCGRHVFNLGLLSILKKYMAVDTFCELGCGSSTLLAKVAKRAQHVTGIDISDEALHRSKELFARKNIANCSFIKADCQNTGLSTQFDTVWSQGLIEHFNDPARIIQEHIKLTKSGGNTLIAVPHKYGFHCAWFCATRPSALRRFWPWPEQIFFSGKLLKESLQKYCPEQTEYSVRAHPLLGIVVLRVRKQ